VRRLFYDLLALVVIALLGAFALAGLGMAQPPGPGWVRAADGCNWTHTDPGNPAIGYTTAMHCAKAEELFAQQPAAQPPGLCGRETKTATGYVRVQCLDYPALRKLTGSPMFPDEKGQQVWTRSSDPTVKAFRVALTYKKDGHLDTVVKYTDAHETYESGAGWVLGDVEITAVEVTELRESLKTAVQ